MEHLPGRYLYSIIVIYIYVNPLSIRAAEGLRSLNRVLKVTPSGRYSLAIYSSSKPERQLSGFTTFAELSLALYVQKIHSVKLKGYLPMLASKTQVLFLISSAVRGLPSRPYSASPSAHRS